MKHILNTSYIILAVVALMCISSYYFYYAWGYDPNRNWSGQIICSPEKIFYPSSVEEIQQIVQQARREGKMVKARGAMHSWSDVACTTGYALDLRHLQKILSVNASKKQVTVETGISVNELSKQLALNNLALPNLGAVDTQTLGGVIATATHGSGKTGTMSDAIVSYQLIDGTGKLRTIMADQSDLFGALRVAIGALGIIYAVTIQCVSLFGLKIERTIHPWQTLKNKIFSLRDSHDYCMFQIDPYGENALLIVSDKIKPTCGKHWLFRLAEYFSYPFIIGGAYVISLFPSLIPWATEIGFKLAQRRDEGPGYELLTGWDPGVNRIEEEIAIDEKDFLNAVTDTIALLKEQARHSRYVIGGITCRFVKRDSAGYLSPAGKSDVVYISLSTPALFAAYHEPLLKEFEKLMLRYNARPHLGKKNFLTKRTAESIYGEDLSAFKTARAQLDPDRLFASKATEIFS